MTRKPLNFLKITKLPLPAQNQNWPAESLACRSYCCRHHPDLAARSAAAPRPRFISGDSFHGLSSLLLRFPPNFVRQLSTKARRNCSNIGVAQIVAASWSNKDADFAAAVPAASVVDSAATAVDPLLVEDDVATVAVNSAAYSSAEVDAVFGNGMGLGGLPDLKEAVCFFLQPVVFSDFGGARVSPVGEEKPTGTFGLGLGVWTGKLGILPASSVFGQGVAVS